jgi:hypothetical protein
LESMGAISNECTMMACGQRQRTASRWDLLLSCAAFCVEVEGGTWEVVEGEQVEHTTTWRRRSFLRAQRNACSHRAAIRRCQAPGTVRVSGEGSGGASVAGRRLAAESLDARRPLTAAGKRGDVSGEGQRPTTSPRHDSSLFLRRSWDGGDKTGGP